MQESAPCMTPALFITIYFKNVIMFYQYLIICLLQLSARNCWNEIFVIYIKNTQSLIIFLMSSYESFLHNLKF